MPNLRLFINQGVTAIRKNSSLRESLREKSLSNFCPIIISVHMYGMVWYFLLFLLYEPVHELSQLPRKIKLSGIFSMTTRANKYIIINVFQNSCKRKTGGGYQIPKSSVFFPKSPCTEAATNPQIYSFLMCKSPNLQV